MAYHTQYGYIEKRSHMAAVMKATARQVRETLPVYENRQIGTNEDGTPKFERFQVGTRTAVYTIPRRQRHEMWPARVRNHRTRPSSAKGSK